MKTFFRKFIKTLGYYALIPFLASLTAGILNLLGVHPYADIVIVPALTAVKTSSSAARFSSRPPSVTL